MLSSLFARRYLLSRKSHSVINIISVVSAVAVSVPVAAMIILLSVFNGFEGLIKNMYTNFDPDILISPAKGKTFEATSALDAALMSVDGVAARSYMVEESAMANYGGGQYIVTLRGVDSLYANVTPIEGMVSTGKYQPYFGDIEQALVGQGVASSLGINPAVDEYITFYAPRRGELNPILPIDNYRSDRLLPSGIFALDAETDSKYILAPIDFARRLFDYPGMATGIAVKLAPGADPVKTREKIAVAIGDNFRPLTRYEQKATLYRIMRYEKWSVFMIIGLVLVIASFSVIGSLVMLIIDKRDDALTIITLGGTVRFLRAVFTREGMLIAGAGAVAGMVIGLGFCLLQQHFGLIKIPAESFLVDSYPVIIEAGDVALSVVSFCAVSFIIVRLTVVSMIPKSKIRL